MNEKELRAFLEKQDQELKALVTKGEEEIKLLGKVQQETKESIDKLAKAALETSARLLVLEQHVTAGGGAGGQNTVKTYGELVTESEGFKAVQHGAKETGKIPVGSFHKTAIINATGQNQPLVPDYRVPGILMPGLRRLTIRDLLPSNRTTSNLIQYTQEDTFTNTAAPQAGENVAKAESALVFSLHNAPVQTLAHWIPASRQVLDDSVSLADYINSRLMFGLKLVEEDQLLNGNGTGQNLRGLVPSAVAFNRVRAGDTDVDAIRRAKTQVADSFFDADSVILNPHDWEVIELVKESTGGYILSAPQTGAPPRLWGMDVVPTPAMPVGQFLCGAFRMAASIWDRWDATIEVSREHQDFFIKNMVAILCEERLALTVFRPSALVYGALPTQSS